jgi:membrane fusion protein (multidrug efflux system)
VRPGQAARVRLEGFPWAQFGSVPAEVRRVASEVRDGQVRVELGLRPAPDSAIPLQHGLPGTVEIAVDRASPALLVLRSAGQRLSRASGTAR